jgi:signal transduction histidine kinase
MSQENSSLLREKGLSFFGIITASLSHEINNSVAIIGELSGLLDDLLLGAQRGRPLDEKKLKGLSEKIIKQVKKGESTIKMLNRFAHSIDDPSKDLDLRQLMEEITALAQRFAFLENVRLETRFVEEAITITSSPFSLQQAIFACIEIALAVSEKDDVVTLTVDKDGTGARIAIESVSLAQADKVDSELSFLSILMKELGGTIEVVSADGDKSHLILTVPQSMPGGSIDADSLNPEE